MVWPTVGPRTAKEENRTVVFCGLVWFLLLSPAVSCGFQAGPSCRSRVHERTSLQGGPKRDTVIMTLLDKSRGRDMQKEA